MIALKDLKQYKGHTSIYWNTRSLLPRLEEIDRIIHEASPEIIGISESWLNNNIDMAQICFDRYSMVRVDRTDKSGKRGGGGVVTYDKSKLNCFALTEYTKCEPHIECVWIALRLPNTKQINIGTIYRPPAGNIDDFIETLEDICFSMRAQRNCEINFGGDINLNIKRRDPKVNKYKDSLKRMGLEQLITDITHISDNAHSASTIDHFVTSDKNLYSNVGVIPHGATDHFLVYSTRKKLYIKHEKDLYRGRAYGKMSKPAFQYDILTHDWSEVYE